MAGSRIPARHQGKMKVSPVCGKYSWTCDFRFHSPQSEPELPLLYFKTTSSQKEQKYGMWGPIIGFPATRASWPGHQIHPNRSFRKSLLTVQPWITTKVLLLWLKWQLATDSATPGMRWQVSSAVSSGVLRANLLSMSVKSFPPIISEKEKLDRKLIGGLFFFLTWWNGQCVLGSQATSSNTTFVSKVLKIDECGLQENDWFSSGDQSQQRRP